MELSVVPTRPRHVCSPPSERGVDPRRVIVAVPALNEAGHIEACLRSLVQGCAEMDRVRIVVADGGSTDGTKAVVRALSASLPNVELIDNPKGLQSAAVNAVAARRAAHEDVLVRCDAHAAYPPGYVLRAAASLLSRDAASLVVPIDARGCTPFARSAAWVVETPLGSGGSAHRGGRRSGWVDHGHHAAFRAAWFERVGGYDETFSHNEDAELDHRIRRAGGRIWLDADVRAAYTMRPTVQALAGQYWRYGRGRARTITKHRALPRARQAAPVLLVLLLCTGVVLSPISTAFLLPLGAYLTVVTGVGVTHAARRGAKAGLWSALALAAMHLSWGAGFIRQVVAGGKGPR